MILIANEYNVFMISLTSLAVESNENKIECKEILKESKKKILAIRAHPNQFNLIGVLYEDTLFGIVDLLKNVHSFVYCIYLQLVQPNIGTLIDFSFVDYQDEKVTSPD
jgi:hypothetical protein